MEHRQAIQQVHRQIKGRVSAKVPVADIADVVQDTLLSCIKAGYLLQADWKVPSRAFVATVTRCRIADYHRARRRNPIALSDGTEPVMSDTRVETEIRDECQHLRSVLAILDPRYRQVLEARYFHDQSHRVTAKYLGKPLETIRTLCKRGLLAIRSALESPP